MDAPHTDLAAIDIEVETGYFIPHGQQQVMVTVTVVSGGSAMSDTASVELGFSAAPDEGTKLGDLPISAISSDCRTPTRLSFVIATDDLLMGTFQFWVRITPVDTAQERNSASNLATSEFRRLAVEQTVYHAWLSLSLK